jgi:Ca2+-binding EF-hand superfamily protein
VCEFEYIKFMLVAMKKIDGELFDDLRYRFHQLNQTGDGKITKKDLVIMAKRKMKKVKNKLLLEEYKASRFTDSCFTRTMFIPDMSCTIHAFGFIFTIHLFSKLLNFLL